MSAEPWLAAKCRMLGLGKAEGAEVSVAKTLRPLPPLATSPNGRYWLGAALPCCAEPIGQLAPCPSCLQVLVGPLVRGEVTGEILTAPRGANGFGYDPLFLYPPWGRSFGEIDAEEKFSVSHRGQALRQLVQYLGSAVIQPFSG